MATGGRMIRYWQRSSLPVPCYLLVEPGVKLHTLLVFGNEFMVTRLQFDTLTSQTEPGGT
jgi:hypothetical protein